MAQNEDYIVEILMDVGLVTRTQVDYARGHMTGHSVIDSLIHEGFITQEDVGRTLAAQNGSELTIREIRMNFVSDLKSGEAVTVFAGKGSAAGKYYVEGRNESGNIAFQSEMVL